MNLKPTIRIWVDADACPQAVREIIFRTAKRLEIETILVANQSIPIPRGDRVRRMTVPDGADIADDCIVERMQANDIVVTGDIPLAARVVEKGGIAIGTRGELYDDAQVHGRLASRNLMEQLRSAGIDTSGPKPLANKDIQAFANQLDRMVTRMIKKSKSASNRGVDI